MLSFGKKEVKKKQNKKKLNWEKWARVLQFFFFISVGGASLDGIPRQKVGHLLLTIINNLLSFIAL